MCDGDRKRGEGKFDFKKGRKEVELWKAANFRHVKKVIIRTIPTPDITQAFEKMGQRLVNWMIDMSNVALSSRRYPLCPDLVSISVGQGVLSSNIDFKMWTFNKDSIADVDRVALWSLAAGIAGAVDHNTVDICFHMPITSFPDMKSDLLVTDFLVGAFDDPFLTFHGNIDFYTYKPGIGAYRFIDNHTGESAMISLLKMQAKFSYPPYKPVASA